jgi:hypothetical protein
MEQAKPRGAVVLADDLYAGHDRRRPFVIISDSNYYFHPNGYLGIPLTQRDGGNTVEILEEHIAAQYEAFEKPRNFVNPWSPAQVNDYGRSLCRLEKPFVDKLAGVVVTALGLTKE